MKAVSLICAAAGSLLAFTAYGLADDTIFRSKDGAVVVTGGVGLMWIRADEYVFTDASSDTNLSLLNWESDNVPVFNGTARIELPRRFLIKGTVEFATGGDHYMTDYDWIEPFAKGTGPDDWSDRSQHDATELDHFWGGSVALGYQLVERDNVTLDLLGGAKYRDVQWTAWGGSYTYSYDRPRDTSGTWPDDEIGITYQQRIPSAFVGLDGSWTHGRWTFSGSVQGGFTFDAEAPDDHWARPLFFVDYIHTAPTVALAADVAYAFTDRLNVHLGVGYDEMFKTRADGDTYDPTTGETFHDENLTGASQRTFKILAGLSGRF